MSDRSLPATTWRFVRIQPFGSKMTPEPTPLLGHASAERSGRRPSAMIRTTAGLALAATSMTADDSSIVTGCLTEVAIGVRGRGASGRLVERAGRRSARRPCRPTRGPRRASGRREDGPDAAPPRCGARRAAVGPAAAGVVAGHGGRRRRRTSARASRTSGRRCRPARAARLGAAAAGAGEKAELVDRLGVVVLGVVGSVGHAIGSAILG